MEGGILKGWEAGELGKSCNSPRSGLLRTVLNTLQLIKKAKKKKSGRRYSLILRFPRLFAVPSPLATELNPIELPPPPPRLHHMLLLGTKLSFLVNKNDSYY